MHEASSRLNGLLAVSSNFKIWMINLHIVVWYRERTLLGDVRRAVLKEVIRRNGISRLVAIEVGRDGKGDVGEAALLHEHLGAHA